MTHVTGRDQSVRLESVGCELRLADIYEEVAFGE